MKIQRAIIKRFRSAEELTLEDIGEFNVLIGKNNSGKSNILLAIDSFFACLKGGNIVTAEPSIGAEIDFFEKRIAEPLEIELWFSLEPKERTELLRDIIAEAPQMKNAVEAIEPAVGAIVSIKVINTPRRAAFINRVALGDLRKCGKMVGLLAVSDASAKELVEN